MKKKKIKVRSIISLLDGISHLLPKEPMEPIENVKHYNGDKFQYKILKRNEIANIGYERGVELGAKFDSPSANVGEDKQVYAGLNYLGMIEGWELIEIDKHPTEESGAQPFGLDEFYFKRLYK